MKFVDGDYIVSTNHVSYIKPSSQLTNHRPHVFREGNLLIGNFPRAPSSLFGAAGFEPDACCDGRE